MPLEIVGDDVAVKKDVLVAVVRDFVVSVSFCKSIPVDVADAVITELAMLADEVVLAGMYTVDDQVRQALLGDAVADGEALAEHGGVVAVVVPFKPAVLVAVVVTVVPGEVAVSVVVAVAKSRGGIVPVPLRLVLVDDEELWVCGTDGVDDTVKSILVDAADAVVTELTMPVDAIKLTGLYVVDVAAVVNTVDQLRKALRFEGVSDGEALAEHGVVVVLVVSLQSAVLLAVVVAVL